MSIFVKDGRETPLAEVGKAGFGFARKRVMLLGERKTLMRRQGEPDIRFHRWGLLLPKKKGRTSWKKRAFWIGTDSG